MTEKNELDYINIAKSNGCLLIFNQKLCGHILHYKEYEEYIPHLNKRTLEQFDTICKNIKRGKK